MCGGVIQELKPQITIGNNCTFGVYNNITCSNSITIEDGLLTGKIVTISDNNHGDSNIETLKIFQREDR